jgi:hypothetical protein
MVPGQSPSTERATALRFAAAVTPVFVGLILLLQWAGGSYHAEFGGYPDEPAHYLTALMIRDYITSGFPRQLASALLHRAVGVDAHFLGGANIGAGADGGADRRGGAGDRVHPSA